MKSKNEAIIKIGVGEIDRIDEDANGRKEIQNTEKSAFFWKRFSIKRLRSELRVYTKKGKII
ncbi:MAG: hypothetical protein H7A25_02605 [Leptospiraceae bacterium]|nr:hypothetical protein [Leptospiraceae bacterium]